MKAVERETLAERVGALEDGLKSFFETLQRALEDLESHHIRVSRVERETGLLS